MVEFSSTAPGTAGNTQDGSTNSFSSKLDAGTLAAVEEPNQSEGGIESLAPGSTAPTVFQTGVMTDENAIAYVMGFDGYFGEEYRDGILDPGELNKAIFSQPGQDYNEGQEQLKALTNLLDCYGEKDGKPALESSMIMSREGVEAMITDGSLNFPVNYNFSDNLGVNVNAIPIERVIRGASYGDWDSTNDGLISKGELVALFATLGHNVSAEQAHFLLHIYGDGNFLSQDGAKSMRDDGFLNTGATLGEGATLNWDNIDGGRISDALCAELGLAAGTELEAEEFDIATDMLFGDNVGVNPQQAVFLTRVFGTGGKLNRDQVAKLFNLGNISITVLDGQNNLLITVKTTAENMDFSNTTEAANYIMLYDTNNDGLLYTDELRAAITPRLVPGVDLTDKDMQTYMDAYGEKRSDGNMSITRDGVLAMLNDGSLSIEGPSQLPSRLLISLDAMPISRVLLSASYGDSVSLNDGLVSEGELIKLFATLGLTLTVDQAVFLTKVYGNGGTNNQLLTQFNVEQMREDGFLVTGAVRGQNCSMNWNAIDGKLIAREIFRNTGIDPDSENASMTGSAFGDGFKRLYGELATLDDPIGLAKNLGTEDMLSVVQMGLVLDGLNTDSSIPLVAKTDAEGRTLTDQEPAYYTTDWWSSVLKFAGDEAQNVVSTIAAIAGVTEDVVAGVLNGSLSVEAGMAKGGYKIVDAIQNAIQTGNESAKNLMATMGTALKSLVSTVENEVKTLSDEGRKVVDQLIAAAQVGATEVEIRTLSMLSGMSAEEARTEIETMAFWKGATSFAEDTSFENLKPLIPDCDAVMADLVKSYDDTVATFMSSGEAVTMANKEGYTFSPDGQLTQNGQIVSEADASSFFGKYCRVDAGVEANLGLSGLMSTINGFQLRLNVCYAGQDASGNGIWQLRIRVLDEAGISGALPGGTVKVDGGFYTVHEIVVPWSVPTEGASTKGDIKWDSTFGMVLEGQAPKLPTDYIPEPLAPVLDQGGVDTDFDLAPEVRQTWAQKWGANADFEAGLGWGMSVSYNLTKMGGGNSWIIPLVAEVSGAVIGGGAATAALSGVDVATAGGATPLLVAFGGDIIHSAAMLGGFVADLAYAGADALFGQGNVSVTFGDFAFVALRIGVGVSGEYAPGDGIGADLRLRGQINLGISTPVSMK